MNQPPLIDAWNFIKYCAVGGSAAAMSVASLYIAVDLLHVPYLPAFACIFVAVSAFGYAASRRLAFRSTQVGIKSGLARYFGVTSAGLLLNSILLVALVEWFGLRPVPATVVLAILNAPVNFLIHKHLTFRIGRNTAVGERSGAGHRSSGTGRGRGTG